MRKEFWIIETDSTGESYNSRSARGPFASVKDAEDWLRNDAADTFMDADKSIRILEGAWAEPVHIVQLVKTVRQCPEVKVTVTLKNETAKA